MPDAPTSEKQRRREIVRRSQVRRRARLASEGLKEISRTVQADRVKTLDAIIALPDVHFAVIRRLVEEWR